MSGSEMACADRQEPVAGRYAPFPPQVEPLPKPAWAVRCPVLTQVVRYASAMRCPVLTQVVPLHYALSSTDTGCTAALSLCDVRY
eukprot:2112833-Rhodomonas_salina.7